MHFLCNIVHVLWVLFVCHSNNCIYLGISFGIGLTYRSHLDYRSWNLQMDEMKQILHESCIYIVYSVAKIDILGDVFNPISKNMLHLIKSWRSLITFAFWKWNNDQKHIGAHNIINSSILRDAPKNVCISMIYILNLFSSVFHRCTFHLSKNSLV